MAIASGTFLDLFELDAASNRGIENIRDVIESASLGLGPSARTKVYVLDEVHMLTDAAANALLKTLEEAPGHVVFVLATTNPEKVLPTIRSRTQHFEFTLLSNEDLIARLSDLCAREGVTADPEALEILATAGAGSARDAESLLDQALAHGVDHLDAATIRELFGGTAFSARARILEAIAGEDAAGALVGLGALLESGHEPRRVAEDLLAAARDAFLLTAARGRVHVSAPTDEQDHLREIGEALGNAALVRVIETLGQAITDMRGVEAADPRLVVEVALVRLSRREAGPPIQTVIERIERLERAQAGEPAAPATRTPRTDAPTPRSRPTVGALRRESAAATSADVADDSRAEDATASAGGNDAERAPAEVPGGLPPGTGGDEARGVDHGGGVPSGAASDAMVMDLDDVIIAWGAIVPELAPATRSAVQNAQPVRFDGDVLVFGVAPELLAAARERFKREADNVRDALAERLGRRFKFKLEPAPELSMSGSGNASNGDYDAGPERATTSNGEGDAERAPAPDVSSGAASDAMEASDADDEDMEGSVAVPGRRRPGADDPSARRARRYRRRRGPPRLGARRARMAKQKPPQQGGMNQMMRQMQRMQEEMAAAQAALADATVEGSAGGGVVTAVATGTGELQRVTISADAVDPDDLEMLEDLVVAAVNDALRKSQALQAEKMGAATSGVDLGALGGLLG